MQRQETLLAELESLASHQHELICAEQTQALLDHMTRRQTVVDAITDVTCALKAGSDDDGAAGGCDGNGNHAAVNASAARIDVIIGRIAALDDASRLAMTALRDGFANQLGQVANARGALSVYGQGGSTGRPMNRFTDREA
ncbi:MAG: hypothetical protein KAS72_01105 [Phycisphaerales bacterium]|nr:hypothetical protein [Phycisphaerales bacterium]